ncbi:uncharacterized protein BJ212DRAFT_1360772 [Suillus subaureus]|uniref:Uncharacterized protein n=1 Tax=Suillus subaureus TaxID=48587 RepID=A0A9P7E8N8_9AGAM|nr:uncharacterized protein BJ212DRAFT_1360772 [Suillus subaureus]KAG1814589.1 hypothetical protein BJ212DRAFT_1360772 [Suillus subaureus]
MTPTLQSKTPMHFLNLNKNALVADFVGKPLDALRTPALVADRVVLAENCRRCTRMRETGKQLLEDTRRHKVGGDEIHCDDFYQTVEGTKLQLVSDIGRSSAVILSTLIEA